MEPENTTVKTSLTREQVALLAEHGLPAPAPHRSTRLRRQARAGGRIFPVISRSGRMYRQSDGRLYGEAPAPDQRQADAGHWGVGAAVREACEPMTVAVGGTVQRIYEIRGWGKDAASGKWIAELGQLLADADLDRDYPSYPYRNGDSCPTRRGGAYRPESY